MEKQYVVRIGTQAKREMGEKRDSFKNLVNFNLIKLQLLLYLYQKKK